MKKISIAVLVVLAVVAFTVGSASAEPKAITGEITVSADDHGLVSVVGSSAGELDRLTQFCTEEINAKFGCPNNIEVPKGNGYQLNKRGMEKGQIAFNLHHTDGAWLWIPLQNVQVGKNVKIFPGKEGSRFVYTGPVPK